MTLNFKKILSSSSNVFMFIFMSQLEDVLNANIDTIDFKSHYDEANVDTGLKKHVKDIIMNNCNKIFLNQRDFILQFGNETSSYSLSNFKNFIVKNVYLPEELTDDIKVNFESDTSVFVNPDLVLEIENKGNIYYESLELKSTLRNKIPGSSVQQIKPFEWVIFFKDTNSPEFITGLYINSITERMQFPDRSPRPEVGFNTLKNWNLANRTINNESLSFLINDEDFTNKMNLINDWQNVLAITWNDVLFDYNPTGRVPWFHNNLRKFILIFIDRYEQLSQEEKNTFKSKNESLIK